MDERALARLPLFAGLGRTERRRVAQLTDEVDVAAGASLTRQGALAYEFFVVEEGEAEVARDAEPIATLGPGDFFGELGLLNPDRVRTASVTARTPMRLAVLTGSQFRHLERELPDVAGQVRAAVEERVPGELRG